MPSVSQGDPLCKSSVQPTSNGSKACEGKRVNERPVKEGNGFKWNWSGDDDVLDQMFRMLLDVLSRHLNCRPVSRLSDAS